MDANASCIPMPTRFNIASCSRPVGKFAQTCMSVWLFCPVRCGTLSPMSLLTEQMTEWIWRQMAIRLPADWECLQFSSDPQAGRCAFADRRRYRLELNWRQFKAEPDFERMLEDYRGSLESSWDNIKSVTCRGWPGLTGVREHETVSRYGRYFSELGLVVEVVFIHEQRRDDELEARVLHTVNAVPPDSSGYQRWRAFGMELRVPKGFTLAECVVEPARVGMRFDGVRKPDRWIFRRYGMVGSWLNVPVRDWLAQQADDFVRDARPETVTHGNTAVERLHGIWRPRGLLLPRGVYTAAAWKADGDGRLYHAICITGKRRIAVHPQRGADEMMNACPEFLRLPKGIPVSATAEPK